MRNKTLVHRLTALALCAALAGAAWAGSAAEPNAKTYGKSLNDWLTTYWTWIYSGQVNVTPFPYQPGPANIVFMPMPNGTQIGGTGALGDPAIYQGELNVTIKPGTGFVLPFFAWIGERYAGWPDVPDDAMFSYDTIKASVFKPGDPANQPTVTLDGKPLFKDFWANYVDTTYFAEPVVYPQPTGYGSVAAIAYQSAGVVMKPLPPGKHVLHLYEEMRLDAWNWDVVYDNTWIINVVPPGKAGK